MGVGRKYNKCLPIDHNSIPRDTFLCILVNTVELFTYFSILLKEDLTFLKSKQHELLDCQIDIFDLRGRFYNNPLFHSFILPSIYLQPTLKRWSTTLNNIDVDFKCKCKCVSAGWIAKGKHIIEIILDIGKCYANIKQVKIIEANWGKLKADIVLSP